jgi:hypothetical protein
MSLFNKTKTKFIDMITFKNEQDNGTLKTGSMVLIMVVLFVVVFYFGEIGFLKSNGVYKLVSLGITCGGTLAFILYYRLLIKETDRKNDNIGNYQKDITNNINEDRERLKSFFKDDTFEEFKRLSIEAGIISEQGKWIFKGIKRDYSILILKLIDSQIIKIKENHKKQFHKAFEEYFGVTFDYPPMTSIIKEGYKALSVTDKETYNSFSFIDRIKV